MKIYLARDGDGNYFLHFDERPPGEADAGRGFYWTNSPRGQSLCFEEKHNIQLKPGQFVELIAGDKYETDLVKRRKKP